jgi:hypothetical protein
MVEGVVREWKRFNACAGCPNQRVTAGPTRKISYLRPRGVDSDHPGERRTTYRCSDATPTASDVEDHPALDPVFQMREQGIGQGRRNGHFIGEGFR